MSLTGLLCPEGQKCVPSVQEKGEKLDGFVAVGICVQYF